MTRVFVVSPAVTTGGPELCHQLVDALNTAEPGRAAVLYHPWGRHNIPEPYRGYDVRPATLDQVGVGDVVVVPETYSLILPELPTGATVFFWWMSVNNFYRSAGADAAGRLADIRARASKHLYQSDYARQFCEQAGLAPAVRLSDKLSGGYLAKPSTGERRDIIAYNPVKGGDRTQLILNALAKGLRQAPETIAIERLSPALVRQVLSQAKVYIDFGGHPGKDRLPREAVACGACVITNRRGAAANDVDVPIPVEFKINDRKPGFERRAVSKIRLLLDDFDRQRQRFDAYRQIIAAEPQQFAADVAACFSRQLVA